MEKANIETVVVKPRMSYLVNDVENRILTTSSESQLDASIEKINNFMMSNVGKGKSDEVKDGLYAEAQSLWQEYADILTDVDYTFYLNRAQHGFLTNLILNQLEYDVNTVFIALELTQLMGEWDPKLNKHSNDKEVRGYSANATEITYMYHLIANYKVKGLGRNTYLFADILRKIGDVSKIISYYDNHAKAISKDIQDWVASFEEGISSDKFNQEETITSEVIAPSKKSKKESIEQ